jgi:exodeoxyribonuclease VII small subunit
MAKTTTTKTYSELTEELDTVMRELEQGELDIDKAVKCYERGLEIVSELETHLKDAENKVTQLKAGAGNGIDDLDHLEKD